MKYRDLARLGACLIMVGAMASTTASAESPPPGAVTAELTFPRVGSQWKVRVTDLTSGISSEETRTLTPTNYKGVSRPGFTNGETVVVLNQANRNIIAILKGGKEVSVFDPDNAGFSWPLWVGKTWQPKFTGWDMTSGRSFPGESPRHSVEAYENVTVPAGTFKAFRIRTSPGYNYNNTSVDWYAPELGLAVKTTYDGNNVRGIQHTVTELLTRPN